MSERQTEWLVCGGLAVTILAIFAAIVLHPAGAKPLPIYGTLPDFALIDQDNQAATLATLRGNVCDCRRHFHPLRRPMPDHVRAHEGNPGRPAGRAARQTGFLHHRPGISTPRRFSKNTAPVSTREDGHWLFLTGDKAALHRATVDGLKLSAVEKSPADQEDANDLFIHSTKLVLIDKEGRIRGYYDGETPESVAQVMAARQGPGAQMKR